MVNNKAKAFIKNKILSFFAKFNIDAFLRYRDSVLFIKKYVCSEKSILEVGSGSLGITPFLNRKVTGVDTNFKGNRSYLLDQKFGKATELDFANDSYYLVLTVGMLEHLSRADRFRAISELIRVAKRYVIITAPSSLLSRNYEKRLKSLYERRSRPIPSWLKEHLKNRPILKEEIVSTINLGN